MSAADSLSAVLRVAGELLAVALLAALLRHFSPIRPSELSSADTSAEPEENEEIT